MRLLQTREYHLNIADNIETIVLQPFSKWCTEHEQRVKFSESTLQDKLKALKNAQYLVEKLQKKYFNKCRMLEEFKSHYTEEELQEELSNLSFQKIELPKPILMGAKRKTTMILQTKKSMSSRMPSTTPNR